MPLSMKCPHCQAGLNVKEKLIGREVPCPKCGKTLTISPHAKSEPAQTGLSPETVSGADSSYQVATPDPDPLGNAAEVMAAETEGAAKKAKPRSAATAADDSDDASIKKMISIAFAGAAVFVVLMIGGGVWWFMQPASQSGGTGPTSMAPPAPIRITQQQSNAAPKETPPQQAGAAPETPPPEKPAEPEWVVVEPKSVIGRFTFKMPAQPKERSISINGTSWSNTVWTLDLGHIEYSATAQVTSNDGKSRAEHELLVARKNRKGQRMKQKTREVDFLDPPDPGVCFEQKFWIGEWRRFTGYTVDLDGYIVGGTYLLPPKGQSLPHAYGFQFVWAESKKFVALYVEVESKYYDANSKAVDADIERFFSSFDRPDAIRREAIDAAKQELIDRVNELIVIVRAGDARESMRQLYPPAEFEALMMRSDAERRLEVFSSRYQAELLKTFHRLNFKKGKFWLDKADVDTDERRHHFDKKDGQWYLQNPTRF